MSFWSSLLKVVGVGAAPFTGGASLAATLIPTAIGVGTSIAGAYLGSRAAGKAADTQAAAATQAGQLGQDASAKSNEILKAIYEGDLTRLEPYFAAGAEGLSQLVEGMKAGGIFNKDFTAADFVKDPGYEFRMQEGQKALERSAAARGSALGGAAVKEALRYGQGFASNEYQNAFNRFQLERNTRWNRLGQLAGYGADATNTALNLGQNYGARVSGNLMEGARIGGEALTGAANARASGYVGSANAWGGALSNIGRTAMDVAMMNRYGKMPGPGSTTPETGTPMPGGTNMPKADYYLSPVYGSATPQSINIQGGPFGQIYRDQLGAAWIWDNATGRYRQV